MALVNKVNIDGMLLAEQSTLRTPADVLRRYLRTAQRAAERELGTIHRELADLYTKTKLGKVSARDGALAIDTMIKRAKLLKEKLAAARSVQTESVLDLQERIKHLNSLHQLAGSTYTSPKYRQFAQVRLNRMVVDYLLRTNRFETAKALAKEQGITRLVDIQVFEELHRISLHLKNASAVDCLTWCKENASALRKIKSPLEFNLRLQEWVELVREGKLGEAIQHAKRNLAVSPWTGDPERIVEIQQAMGLLVFGRTTKTKPYREWFNPNRWLNIHDLFIDAAYSLLALSSKPLLTLTLSAGLSALKTRQCYIGGDSKNAIKTSTQPTSKTATPFDPAQVAEEDRAVISSTSGLALAPDPSQQDLEMVGVAIDLSTHVHENPNRSVDCPVCDPILGSIASSLPFSHHTNSTLVCRISGKIMDENNPPMALPNGYIYSKAALEEMVQNGGSRAGEFAYRIDGSGTMGKPAVGQIVCPRTGELYDFSRAKKLYIS